VATTELLENQCSIRVVATILTNQEAKDGDRLKAAELTKWGGLASKIIVPRQVNKF